MRSGEQYSLKEGAPFNLKPKGEVKLKFLIVDVELLGNQAIENGIRPRHKKNSTSQQTYAFKQHFQYVNNHLKNEKVQDALFKINSVPENHVHFCYTWWAKQRSRGISHPYGFSLALANCAFAVSNVTKIAFRRDIILHEAHVRSRTYQLMNCFAKSNSYIME